MFVDVAVNFQIHEWIVLLYALIVIEFIRMLHLTCIIRKPKKNEDGNVKFVGQTIVTAKICVL